MTPEDIAEGRRLVEAANPIDAPLGPWGQVTHTANGHYVCASGPWILGDERDPQVASDAALIVYLRNHAVELLDAAGRLADVEVWAKRQYDRAEKAERERDEARAVLRQVRASRDRCVICGESGDCAADCWLSRALGES